MLYLTCTTISSVDLTQYRVALAKDWVSVVLYGVETGKADCSVNMLGIRIKVLTAKILKQDYRYHV